MHIKLIGDSPLHEAWHPMINVTQQFSREIKLFKFFGSVLGSYSQHYIHTSLNCIVLIQKTIMKKPMTHHFIIKHQIT